MADVKNKIAKLLALANSPEPEEAKAALLRARELMAKYKLRPDECQREKKVNVINENVGVFCTKMTDAWAVELSVVIASHYCCTSFHSKYKRAKKSEIGFIGLEDDFEICKRVFLYAYDSVKAQCAEIRKEHQQLGYSGSTIREMCNAYGWGFCRGLKQAYQRQQEQHREWGLVMVVPQAVQDVTDGIGKPVVYAREATDGWRRRYAAAGYEDGEKFDPAHRLSE